MYIPSLPATPRSNSDRATGRHRDPYQAIEAILPWTAFVDSVAEAEQLARPARFDPLALLATAFPRVRRYAPTLLDSFQFNGRVRVNHCSTA